MTAGHLRSEAERARIVDRVRQCDGTRDVAETWTSVEKSEDFLSASSNLSMVNFDAIKATFVDATIGAKRLRRGARLWSVAKATFKTEPTGFCGWSGLLMKTGAGRSGRQGHCASAGLD